MRLTKREYEILKARTKRAYPELKYHKQVRPMEKKKVKEENIERALVCIQSFRCSPLDRDNLWGGTKIFGDCLKELGIIQDDSEQHIELHVSQVKVKTRAEERTEIEVIK